MLTKTLQPRPAARALTQAAVLLAALAALPAGAQDALLHNDPAKVRGAEACGECHADEYEVWKTTSHATGFRSLHRTESSARIAEKMDVKLVKRESLCLECHYTATLQKGQVRAAAGVSCESCHGAGADWIDVHNDYGPNADFKTESAEHREQRIRRSVEAGMRRPSDLYPVARSCMSCHLVLHEKLVNVGGHPIGTGDFELAARIQGEIRHNFLAAQHGGTRDNVQRSQEQLRRVYVAGRAAALEMALRGVASATEEGVYVKAMIRRVRVAVSEVRTIARSADLPEVQAMVDAVRDARVSLGQGESLLAAADAVRDAGRRFLERHDGTALASLDPLMRGEAVELADEGGDTTDATVADTGAADTGAADGDTPGAAPASPDAPAATKTSSSRRSPGVPAVGQVKRRIRPPSDHRTLGPGACSRCHGPQNGWWFDDEHYTSADPFFDQRPENVKIARLYGIQPSEMTRGDRVCMDCHGTVVSGKERREVQDGVSCESCHGAAADWLEPHQEGDKSLGLERPGYKAGLRLGKNELKNAAVRARNCTGCHYVTEPRLISAGHPSGKDFDYAEATKKVKHWETPIAPATLAEAFRKELASRGAVPQVRKASLGEEETAPTPTGLSRRLAPRPAATAGTAPRRTPSPGTPSSAAPSAGTPAAAAAPDEGFDAPAVGPLDLPPFPEIGEGVPVEDVLLRLKQRLELLYQKVYPSEEEPR